MLKIFQKYSNNNTEIFSSRNNLDNQSTGNLLGREQISYTLKEDLLILKRVLGLSVKYWPLFAVSFVFMLVSSFLAIWPSFVLKLIGDIIATGEFLKGPVTVDLLPSQVLKAGFSQVSMSLDIKNFVNYVPVILTLVFFIDSLFKFLYNFFMLLFSLFIVNDLRLKLYKKILNLSVQTIRSITVGDLASRVSNDVGLLMSSIPNTIVSIIKDSANVIIFSIVLISVNLKLTVILLLTLPVLSYITSSILQKIKVFAFESNKESAKLSAFLIQSIQGTEIISLTNSKQKFFEHFRSSCERVIKIGIKSSVITMSVGHMLTVAGALVIGTVAVWTGLTQVINNEITVGDFGSFVVVSLMLYAPAKRLMQAPSNINNVLGSSYRVFALLDTEEEQDAPEPELVNINKNKAESFSIKFNNISFSYEKDKPVLKNINFSIKQGEKVALIGKSGEGKSSLLKLVSRFYEPNSGEIFLGDLNINKIRRSELRDNISLVLQNTLLFDGTLRENLEIAKPNSSDKEKLRALELANVDFLDLIGGLDAQMKEQGLSLSGGQNQRIGLARAFLRNTPILLLDEPTSSLDVQSEELVRKALFNLMQEKTVILVTHRLNLVRDFDKIICMKNGEISEIGSHEELSQKESGDYKEFLTSFLE